VAINVSRQHCPLIDDFRVYANSGQSQGTLLLHRLVAARYMFCRVLMAGLCALCATQWASWYHSPPGIAIQALAVVATWALASSLLTNLALPPILLCGHGSPGSVRPCNGLSLNAPLWAHAPRADLYLTVPEADAILVPTK
jgi:hypothetical protein